MNYQQRQIVASDVLAYAKKIKLSKLIKEHGTPLLILDTAIIEKQYRELMSAMPKIKFHYALKANSHPSIVRTISKLDGYIDVATPSEINRALSNGISANHCMHSHPIKKPIEIDGAYDKGIRLFVVENMSELDKFVGRPKDIRLLIRLSFPNSDAKSNLSYKFGASSELADQLIRQSQRKGLNIAGFTLHVGSQIPRVDAFSFAISETIQLMNEMESKYACTFTILNIGGGFPIAYQQKVPSIAEFSTVVNQAIKPLEGRIDVYAEPGRFIAAPAAIEICSVVGVAERYDMPWYYIDDGLYGNLGNIIWEDTHPMIISMREAKYKHTPKDFRSSVLAGPTCDSVDIVMDNHSLPMLDVGDHIICINMGAYTSETATSFNSIPIPTTVVVDSSTY